MEKELIDKIDDVTKRGGIAVLPAFAVSRSQELAMVLKNSGFNVWYDGMGRKVSKVFLKYPKYLRSVDDLKKALNKSENNKRDSKIKTELSKAYRINPYVKL